MEINITTVVITHTQFLYWIVTAHTGFELNTQEESNGGIARIAILKYFYLSLGHTEFQYLSSWRREHILKQQ